MKKACSGTIRKNLPISFFSEGFSVERFYFGILPRNINNLAAKKFRIFASHKAFKTSFRNPFSAYSAMIIRHHGLVWVNNVCSGTVFVRQRRICLWHDSNPHIIKELRMAETSSGNPFPTPTFPLRGWKRGKVK
jgi:hypothetical protein